MTLNDEPNTLPEIVVQAKEFLAEAERAITERDFGGAVAEIDALELTVQRLKAAVNEKFWVA